MADPDAPRLLEIAGHLTLELEGAEVLVEARGESICVEFPSLGATASAYRQLQGPVARRSLIEWSHRRLSQAGLTVHLAIGPKPIGRLGREARPGLLSKLLGLGPLELHLGGIFGSNTRPTGPRET